MAVETSHNLIAAPLDHLHRLGDGIKGFVGDTILRSRTGGYSLDDVKAARAILGQEIPDPTMIERWKDRRKDGLLTEYPIVSRRSPFEGIVDFGLTTDTITLHKISQAIDNLSPEKAWEDMTTEAHMIDNAVRSAKLPGWLVKSL